MNRTFKAAVAALTLAVSFAGAVAAGPLEDGVAAYWQGDYATALRLIRPTAGKGNAQLGSGSICQAHDRRSAEAGPRMEAPNDAGGHCLGPDRTQTKVRASRLAHIPEAESGAALRGHINTTSRRRMFSARVSTPTEQHGRDCHQP
jgi:hypothetical protein